MSQGPDGATPPFLTFRRRDTCPACGADEARPLWSGRFDDPQIRAQLARYHYSGDWQGRLGAAPFEMCLCPGCGMKWHRYVFDQEGVFLLYTEWADAEQARRFEAENAPDKHDRRAQSAQMAKLVLRLEHLAGGHNRPLRLLDFGCGDGALLRVAKALAADATGVDMSASRAQAARSEGLVIHPDLDALDATAPAPFDAIVLSQVLEHLSDPAALVKSLRARLRPGGILFVAVPDTGGVEVPRDFHQFTLVQPLEHVNAFTPASLRAFGIRHGFSPVRRPSAFFTTRAAGVLRAAANWIWQPKTTDVFFRHEG